MRSLSAEKFRSFAVCWGPDGNKGDRLVIHGDKWAPMEMEMKREGVMKYLGVEWDMSMDGGVQLLRVLDIVKDYGGRILKSRVRKKDKMTVLLNVYIQRFYKSCNM